MAKPGAKKALLKLLKSTFPRLADCEEIDVKDAYRLSAKKVKLHIKDYPFQLNLYPDGKALHLYPEQTLNVDGGETVCDSYILFDPDRYFSQICGFYRLEVDDAITLGGANAEQRTLINISKDTPERKLKIGNDDGWLTFKSYISKPKSCISPLLKDKKVNRIINWRMKKLSKIRKIFGGPIEKLPADEALCLIKQVNSILKSEAHRPVDRSSSPGAVVALPAESKAVIVGDLHAKPDNLLVVLSQNGFLEALEEGIVSLIILGDAVHPEGDQALEDMDSSMLMMDLIFKLKIQFPDNIFYIRGNHDGFSDDISKRGVPQGLIWADALRKTRGKSYKEQMIEFYRQIPYIVFSKHFIACHAGPPTTATDFNQLVNLRDYPKIRREIVTNRLKSSVRPVGYSKGDIKRFRKSLGVAADTPVIVGHTPLSTDDTIWENVGNIENHHIVYASDSHWVGVMTQIDDKFYPLKYPVEPLSSILDTLEDW